MARVINISKDDDFDLSKMIMLKMFKNQRAVISDCFSQVFSFQSHHKFRKLKSQRPPASG